ncbi:hypothetical protein BACCAP_00321 [Pseudoflavonifractor capillosus ATCC 29799]|uniref:Uncharacterized protein n=1 Tax=Pseudoflavonifractor capillosus ATCC 29799 TaxID=411467 RepID=A6NQ52_9FIRM|nr:hypothetical protein BACCAP_00321 [Pseudoflavonifractor capillosus ATCC 29799]
MGRNSVCLGSEQLHGWIPPLLSPVQYVPGGGGYALPVFFLLPFW